MKLAWATALLLLSSTGVSSLTIPSESSALVEGNDARVYGEFLDLGKRRGGGGRSGSSGGSSGGRSSSSSNRGGSQASYGDGRYYAGGARTPYTAGSKSPRGITPFILPVAALAFFPGIWLYGAYAYPYHNPYYYEDEHSHRNESMPVVCVCQEYQECGCDDNNNSTYYESLFNGTQPRNTSNTRVANVNGTEKIYINGTLANGTTAADGSSSGALTSVQTLLHVSGYWVTAALVATAVWVF